MVDKAGELPSWWGRGSGNMLEQNLEMVIAGKPTPGWCSINSKGRSLGCETVSKPMSLLSLAGTSWARQDTLFTGFSLVTIEELNLAGGLDWCANHVVTRPAFDTKRVHTERGSNPWLPLRLVHWTSRLYPVFLWTHWGERCEASLKCRELCSLKLASALIFISYGSLRCKYNMLA